jgi:outer membrane cobalamin receptor
VDVLKALQLLHGVQSGGEGQSGLYVRGGSPDQNLILMDGVPIYNASHLFGFFSVFNADAIKDVKLIKGGFPARYGGRLSSVIDISMKDGHKSEYHGNVSIGVVSSKATIEGPIKEDKTSFLVSARRTYLDILARPLIKESFQQEGSDGVVGYYFYDLNAKIHHKISDKNQLFFSVYNGRDKFYFEEEYEADGYRDVSESDLAWGNNIIATRWNHLWTPKL